MSESEYDSSDSPVYLGQQAAEVESDNDSEEAPVPDDAREETTAGVQEHGGVGITGEFEGDEEGSSGEESAEDSSDESEGSDIQEGDNAVEEGHVNEPETEQQNEAAAGDERLGEEQNLAFSGIAGELESDHEERGDEERFEGAGDSMDLRVLETSPSGSAGKDGVADFEEPAEQGSFQDSGETEAKLGDADGNDSEEEVTDVMASTSRQVEKFLKESDSENSDLELDLPGPSSAVEEKGDGGEERQGEKESAGKGEGEEDGGQQRAGEAEMRGEEAEESQSTLERSFTGGMDGVFGEESDDEEVGPRERKRRREPGEEGSPIRKKIRESDASSEEGGVASGANESAELQEEVAELQVEGEGVPEVGVEGVIEEKAESDDELEDDDSKMEGGLSDWDIMMQRRKEAMARKRRRRKGADITLYDDSIMIMIRHMKQASEEDRQLNLARKTATKKLQLLSTVVSHLKKSDLQTAMIECGILSALAEWLSPLPDHSLPHLKIRESILDTLKTYPTPDSNLLKSSKIGKAVMLLYRHPKETKKNREKAGKLINDWARPIFGLASDFKSLSRDEREERDYANLSQAARRRLSSSGESKKTSLEGEEYGPQKPGDKGWVGRARVPMPSTRDYVVRPKWNAEQEFKKGGSKTVYNRYEKHLQKQKQKKTGGKSHAVSISVEGRHMPL